MFKLKTLILLAGVALTSFTAHAQVTERTIRFTGQNIAAHPIGQAMVKFADSVTAKSGGKIKIANFPGGTLGGDLQNIAALQGGTLDMIVLNTGLLQNVQKEMAVVDLPFLFATGPEADAVVDGPIGKKLHALLEDKGIVGLGYWELGFRNVTNSKRPITKIEDFAGLKLRVVQAPLFIDLFNTLGTNATPMAWPEVYGALEQKVVDGQENPFATIRAAKFPEVQKFLSVTNHIYNPQSVLISKKTWDGLSAEEKKIIGDSINEATAFQRAASRAASDEARGDLAKAGMVINDISPAEMQRIRDAIKPVIAKYSASVGEPLVAEVQAALAAFRAKK